MGDWDSDIFARARRKWNQFRMFISFCHLIRFDGCFSFKWLCVNIIKQYKRLTNKRWQVKIKNDGKLVASNAYTQNEYYSTCKKRDSNRSCDRLVIFANFLADFGHFLGYFTSLFVFVCSLRSSTQIEHDCFSFSAMSEMTDS